MSECAKIKRLLSRYLDKESSPADITRIEAHLAACRGCAHELAQLTAVRDLVAGKERTVMPQDFLVYRLREQIARERAAAPGTLSWLADMGAFSRKLIPVPVTAIALSMVLLIMSSGRQATTYALDESILNGMPVTPVTALEVILGEQD